MKHVLAIDLGSTMGFAYRERGVIAGSIKLATDAQLRLHKKDKCAIDPRISFFYRWLKDFLSKNSHITIVAYEDVKFVHSQAQAHLWASFRTVVWIVCAEAGVGTTCCPVQTLKKFATGSGAADKADMFNAMITGPLEYLPVNGSDLDDNAVDAVHLLRWANQTFKHALDAVEGAQDNGLDE